MIRKAVGELLVRAGLKLLGLDRIAEEAARELEADEANDSPAEGPRGPSHPPSERGIDKDEDAEPYTSLGPRVSKEGMRMRAEGESSTPLRPEPVPLPGSIEARMAEARKKLRV